MILDHIGLAVSDVETSKRFYDRCLAPLGIELLAHDQDWIGYGRHGKAEFWFGRDNKIQLPMHIAFTAASRGAVDRFYRAALAADGIDNGTPGIRDSYHPDYYSAFVLDPDGHNIEAVCHLPSINGTTTRG